jgi:predicted small integral membrane protein
MNDLIFPATIVVTIAGVVTWLAIRARQPRVKSFLRYLLLTAAISSTTLLVASLAFYVALARGGANSPAAFIPLALAIVCAVVALPSWAGFVVVARHKPGGKANVSDK